VVEHVESGQTLEIGDRVSVKECLARFATVRDFARQTATLARELDPEMAVGPHAEELQVSVGELILEGLYCHNRLNKSPRGGGSAYKA
ncbi:MAG: magnesium chelatase, partial [Planctomycetota bacterium]|nr:magnesium chelatase [Planctomycetota bacterium]